MFALYYSSVLSLRRVVYCYAVAVISEEINNLKYLDSYTVICLITFLVLS
jgi:hypothetical protein